MYYRLNILFNPLGLDSGLLDCIPSVDEWTEFGISEVEERADDMI